MKLYCDEMLIGLGRWLRAAGHDTEIADNTLNDRQILQQSLRQGRRLITRDRKLMLFREAPGHVVLLGCNEFIDCIAEVTARLDIDWLYQPFSRCLNCNSILVEATVEQVTHLNHSFKKSVNNVYYCEHCDQLYWDGSHVTRMRARLHEFKHQFYQGKPL